MSQARAPDQALSLPFYAPTSLSVSIAIPCPPKHLLDGSGEFNDIKFKSSQTYCFGFEERISTSAISRETSISRQQQSELWFLAPKIGPKYASSSKIQISRLKVMLSEKKVRIVDRQIGLTKNMRRRPQSRKW